MQHITLRQLRAVTEIAQTSTISAAAKQLHVSPSAISLTLKQVEEEAGVPLFERSASGFRVTAAGHELVLAAARVETILRECSEVIDAIKGTSRGKVTVGVVSTAKYFAPYLLAAFRKQHPESDIVLKVGNREETIAQLEDYTLDLAIMGRPPQSINVQKTEVGPHPHVIIAAPDHSLARSRSIPAAKLSGEVFLLREPGSGTRMLTERILSDIGATPKTGMEISSNETIKQAVMAGLGIAMLSLHTVAQEIEDGRLIVLRVEGTPVIRKWYVVRLSQKRIMPLAQSLWTFIEKNGSKFFPR
jgi:LysR family transcriptional regulator, low CO2-responsive transcriptional regulator